MREQHRLAQNQNKKAESWQYRLLMAIPRNLVYVFLCVIIFAFLGMLYVIYSERDISRFMDYTHTHENVVVHPLFQHFKNIVDEVKEVPVETINNMTS